MKYYKTGLAPVGKCINNDLRRSFSFPVCSWITRMESNVLLIQTCYLFPNSPSHNDLFKLYRVFFALEGFKSFLVCLVIPNSIIFCLKTYILRKCGKYWWQSPHCKIIKRSFHSIFADKSKPDEATTIISRADQLYNQNEISQLYDYLISFKDVENDEILWRLARAAVDKGKHSGDEKEKRKLYFDAFDYTKKALAINEKNFAVHKVSETKTRQDKTRQDKTRFILSRQDI